MDKEPPHKLHANMHRIKAWQDVWWINIFITFIYYLAAAHFSCFLVWGNYLLRPHFSSWLLWVNPWLNFLLPHNVTRHTRKHPKYVRIFCCHFFLNNKEVMTDIFFTQTQHKKIFKKKATPCPWLCRTTARHHARPKSMCIFQTSCNHLFAAAAHCSCLAWSWRNPDGKRLKGPRGPSNGELDH